MKLNERIWFIRNGDSFFVVSKSLFILLCRVNKNFVSIFIAKLTNPKSTNILKELNSNFLKKPNLLAMQFYKSSLDRCTY